MLRAGTLVAAVALAAGCTGLPKPSDADSTARPQAADDLGERLANAKVGDKTSVSNTEPIQVSAVGLVWNLAPGTGSPAGGEWRPMLERNLRKLNLPNPARYLDDPNRTCAMVLVTANIPAGAKKGDPIDIDVVLPRGSQCTSLKNGSLFECELATSEQSGSVRDAMVKNGAVDPNAAPVMGNNLLLGKALVRARGPLVAGTAADTAKVKGTLAADPEDKPQYTVARVWGGGTVLEDRLYWLVLNEDEKSTRLAMEIAARLNATFQPVSDTRSPVAKAITKEVVAVGVPPAYRLNHTRFLVVARNVPLLPVGPDSLLRKKLTEELLDPTTSIVAAVKLEALGAESQQPLRVGLQSDSPWVRFAAAEALAYLGSTAGVNELARLAEQNPAVRTHCLTALASLDDGISADRLRELMAHPDQQLRYGAFVALRSANPRHPGLNGKHVKDTFWVHAVAPESQGLIHLTATRRSEVVLFGNAGELAGPFSLPIGTDYVVSAKAGDEQVTVTKIVQAPGGAKEVVVKTGPRLSAVLAAVGELGGGYSEAVELVRRASSAKALATPVAIDAAPRGVPLTELAKVARTDPSMEQANLDVVRANRGDLPAGYDLPTEADAVKQASATFVEPALNRNPGRIFGGKPHPAEADAEPAKPAAKEKEKEAGPDLARSPGRLFGK